MNRPLAQISSLVVVAALMLAGCGGSPSRSAGTPTTVLLDWTANPAHSGILTALAQRLDRKEGVRVTLRTPGASADAVRLLLAGRTDLAVMDIHDLAIARERGRDLVAVMAVVGRPLASVIATPRISRPRDLERNSVAVTGTPSDSAVVNAMVAGDGGNPRLVTLRNSGFGAVQAMLGGRTGAAVGFFNEEGVAVTANRPAYHVFRLDRFGSPAYPELVLVAARKTVKTRPKMVEGVVKAFSDGTATAVSHPAVAAAAVRNRIGAADPKLFTKRLAAALSALLPPSGKAGSLDPAVLAQWAGWEVAHGLVSRRPNVQAMFDTRFAG